MSATLGDLVLSKLSDFDLKKQSGNEWRCNSPLRAGSNSHAFSLTLASDYETGAYYDHVSQDSGSLFQLADKLGIRYEKASRGKAVKTKVAYTSLEEYARLHGVSAQAFLDAGWTDVQMVDYHEGSRTFQRPAFVFKTASGIRYRYTDGEKPYYKHGKAGYKACWYGLSKAIDKARQHNTPIVLCNGEASTVVAQAHGLPAFAMTGGEKRLPDELLKELVEKWDGIILIALDCDDTGRKAANEVLKQLPKAQILDLGLTDGGDLADFCLLHGASSASDFYRLMDEAPKSVQTMQQDGLLELANAVKDFKVSLLQQQKLEESANLELQLAKLRAEIDRVENIYSKPKFTSFETVAQTALDRLNERQKSPNKIFGLRTGFTALDRTIGGLQPGTINVVYGATSMGKSTMITSCLRMLVQQGSGLILATESDPVRYMYKIAAALANIASDRIENGQLTPEEHALVNDRLYELMDMRWNFLDAVSPSPEQLRASVLDSVATYNHRIVIIDSISNMCNAADYATVAAANNTVQRLAHETKLPFLITSQVGRDVANRPAGQKLPRLQDGYGGGVIENNADVVLGIYRHGYYVAQGTENPKDDFPDDMVLGLLLKNRWGGKVGKHFKLKYLAGAGFYPIDTTQEVVF